MLTHIDNVPTEMRWHKSWCVAGADKSPWSWGAGGLYRADVTNPDTWMDFEDACGVARQYGMGVGYVIHANDPFTCIDLDVVDEDSQRRKGKEVDPSKWTTPAELARYWQIVQKFDSYAELSQSGKGIHIWVLGGIGKGGRRDGVEVYSQERFIICTGKCIHDKPVDDRQELLNVLIAEIRAGQNRDTMELVELEAEVEDVAIWRMAREAANSSKFIALCEGRWKESGYPSQSEADFALMSMFCFYTKSNEQARRMFRHTALGQREKAVKNDRYLNFTLQGIRGRQQREAGDVAFGAAAAERLFAAEAAKAAPQDVASLVQQLQTPMTTVNNNQPAPPPAATALAQMLPHPVVIEDDRGLDWPPGFAGALAGCIYQSAPRPVKEVAIVAALGLLAGICGKTFSIPQSGLNLYIILVARSAIGKEAMHSGISNLMESIRSRSPQAMSFVDFNDPASGPALMKAVSANTSFLNVCGEWGRKLKSMASDIQGPMQSLRTVMTNLYQKSGPSAIVGGINYSKSDQNIASVSGVAYSMIGETTPGTLYESLTDSMMEDGFLSRFLIVEYTGGRPPHNWNAIRTPDPVLGDALANLCTHSLSLLARNARQEVGRDEATAELFYKFDKECDAEINATNDEAQRQMWNRAALKVLRVAALLAAADNHIHPVIQVHHLQWAIDLVRRDIGIMSKRLQDGDIGLSDDSREKKVITMCMEYLTNGCQASYKIPNDLHVAHIIPRKFLQMRLAQVRSFSSHKLGSTRALDLSVASLIASGYLKEVPELELRDKYAFHGKAYWLVSR